MPDPNATIRPAASCDQPVDPSASSNNRASDWATLLKQEGVAISMRIPPGMAKMKCRVITSCRIGSGAKLDRQTRAGPRGSRCNYLLLVKQLNQTQEPVPWCQLSTWHSGEEPSARKVATCGGCCERYCDRTGQRKPRFAIPDRRGWTPASSDRNPAQQ